MPDVDMPLEELRTYTGVNPRPGDFDHYWDTALAELEGVEPNVEIRKADFSVPFCSCDHLFFDGTGGSRIHAKLLRPAGPAPSGGRPAVLQFHGYTGDSGDWSGLLRFVAAGFVVAALDCRGQGGLSEDLGGVRGNTYHGHIIRGLDDGPEKLLFRHIFLDTVRLARIVMDLDEVDENRLGACGGSQGGGLTLACAALEPRIRRIASTFPFLSDYKRVWDMDLDERAYSELREFFKHFDPTHARADETFRRLGYIDVHHLASRIKANTLMQITLLDDVCPPSTQYAAFNRIEAPKRAIVYPDFGHEGLPGGDDAVFLHLMDL